MIDIEIAYHISGVLAALFLLLVVFFLKKGKAERIKSRIFLGYAQFRFAFYIAALGAVLFVIGNAVGLYAHEQLMWVHNITEVLYNISIMAFAALLLIVLRPKAKKEL